MLENTEIREAERGMYDYRDSITIIIWEWQENCVISFFSNAIGISNKTMCHMWSDP